MSEEQVESSVIKTLTFGVGQIHGIHNLGQSAITVPKTNHVDPEIEALKCSDQKSCHEKSDVMVEEKEACLVSNSVNYNDGLDNLEDVSTVSFPEEVLNMAIIITAAFVYRGGMI